MNDSGYLFWLQSKTGGALRLVRNAGCNGQDSADLLTNYAADVVGAPYHDAVIILTGYNDWVNAGYTTDQVYANVVEMVQQSVGKLVVVVSSLPWTTGGTAANRLSAIRYNRKIRAFCSTMRNVRFADAAKYLIDATNATKFSPLANMLQSDGIHPSPKGAERIAQAIYDAIQYEYPRVSRMVSCSGDNYGADSANPNILDAAPWTTSGGALAGGATGTAAAGIAVTNTGGGTVVASVVARADGIGYDQQVVFTPSANNDSVTISGAGNITGRTADGQSVNYIGELTLSGMSGANIKSVEIYLSYAGVNSYHYLAKAQAANAAGYPSSDMTIAFASLVDSVICTGHTGVGWNVVIKAGAAGTALTAKLGLQSIEKF
jgi:lysophospholipase L1-like esterase